MPSNTLALISAIIFGASLIGSIGRCIGDQTINFYSSCDDSLFLNLFNQSSGKFSVTGSELSNSGEPYTFPPAVTNEPFFGYFYASTAQDQELPVPNSTRIIFDFTNTQLTVVYIDVRQGYNYDVDLDISPQSIYCQTATFVAPATCQTDLASQYSCIAPVPGSSAYSDYTNSIQNIGSAVNALVLVDSDYAINATQQCAQDTIFDITFSCPHAGSF